MASAIRSLYSIGGKDPKLVADFDDEYYRANGGKTTFSDLITHARAGNATMTDSDGLIKWAPHNLLAYSEDFTNAAWVASGSTTKDGIVSGVGPEGEDAYEVTLSGTTNDWFQQLVSAVPDGVRTTTDWLIRTKTGEGTKSINFKHGRDTFYVSENVTEDWAYIETSNTSSGNTKIYFGLSYTGGSPITVQVIKATAFRSDLGGMVDNPDRGDSYVPTTSSAVYLPRRGHHVYNGYEWVNEGVLAESESRSNLVTYSDFSSGWTVVNAPITASAAVSPSGQNDAVYVKDSTFNGIHFIYLTTGSLSNTWTFSAYIKQKDSGMYAQLRPSGLGSNIAYATFDPTDGSVYESGGSALEQTTSEDVGNGWYRVSITCSEPLLSGDGVAVAVTDGTAGDLPSYAGTGTGFYIYGAQVESASTSSSYIPTSGSSVTRAAETFTIPSAKLPWPTPQYIGDELVDNGDFATTSDWSLQSGVSIGGGVLSTDGTSTGELARQSNIGVTSGNLYAISLDVISLTAGKFGVKLGGTTPVYFDTTGSHEAYIVATATDNVQIMGLSGTIGSVDNVSVREVNPLSVSIQLNGRMTYADEDNISQVETVYWYADSDNNVRLRIATNGGDIGQPTFQQSASATADAVVGATDAYSPNILVPYNLASRHGSTFINGAVDGVALTENDTPVALPDLSSTDLSLAYTYMGTLKTFRMWNRDIGDTGIAEATS